MNKKLNALLVGSGIAAFGMSVAWIASHVATKTMVNAALDRELPEFIKKKMFFDFEKDDELIQSLKLKAEKLKNSVSHTVEIQSHDNEKLVGHWKRNDNEKRIIIAMHGWRSSWIRDFCAISGFWDDNGCSVLYAEQRGQGSSGGDYMGFGMIERYDCLNWIKWVSNHNTNNVPVYLAGISMGASTVLMASGFELPKCVCGIIADCGFTSAKAIWKHVAQKNMHLPYNIHSKQIEDWCKRKINLSTEYYTTLDALKNNKIPILFVHGTDDGFVPIEMTYENYKMCIAPKTLLVVPGADHAMSYIVDKAAYESTVLHFWQQNDKTFPANI